MFRAGYVYILASKPYGTLYIGVTNDLVARVHKHRLGDKRSFTGRYKVYRLVYFEQYDDIREAIWREKELKGWTRRKKIELILTMNPAWRDLMMDET